MALFINAFLALEDQQIGALCRTESPCPSCPGTISEHSNCTLLSHSTFLTMSMSKADVDGDDLGAVTSQSARGRLSLLATAPEHPHKSRTDL